MSVKVIPESRIYVCDICLKEHKRPAHNPKLTYHQDGLDYSGHAVGDATSKYDLCNNCDSAFNLILRNFIDAQRKANP